MKLTENARLIEAILYLENEPLSIERLCSMTGLSESAVSEALTIIEEAYYSDDHGLALVENSETYSFVPVSTLNDKGLLRQEDRQAPLQGSAGDLVYSCLFPAHNQK